jgi:uncharacterized protein involved in exopolysaccharide biosynthesis
VDHSRQTTLENPADQELVMPADMQDMEIGQDGGDLQFIALIRLLWDQRVRLAKATLASFVVAVIVAFLIPHTYEATVHLMPPDSSALSGSSPMLGLLLGAGGMGGSSSSGGSGLAGTVSDLLGGQKPGPLFIGILGSRTLSDRMIDRFDLRKVYWVKTYFAARKKLLSRASFLEEKKSGIIGITVEDRDPARATAMAQAYVEELDGLLSHVNTSSASREREFLEKRLTVIHAELQDATKDLSEFSSQNATLDPQDQGKAMLESAATLQGQLIAAKSELSGLLQVYSSENVRVRSLRAHISELEQQLNAFGGKGYAGSAVLDPNSLYPSIRQLPVLGRQYVELYRRAKVDETVYQLLTEAYEMARVQEAKETPSVKVLDDARLPERPSGTPRRWLAFGGTLLGFLFAASWIVGAKWWADLDPNEPYKAFLSQEILPALRRMATSVRVRWQQISSRIHHSSNRESA